ncbi:hypothetical protein LIER_43319 [Lithospermum erythrorhizon]|uniref:Uncharacterized protein n=1 Tax=Lithospermum erythrorhizon TaxID=34254 RepID=A0AAV3PZE0_LITER
MFSEALNNVGKYPLCPNGEPFIVSALGNDSLLLDESFVVKLFENLEMIQVLVLLVATPSGLVGELGLEFERFGLDWEMVRKRCPTMVVAAHGSVTASGVEQLGVGVDVVSSRFDSFVGVVDSLAYKWETLGC